MDSKVPMAAFMAVKASNNTVGPIESRVMVTARKLHTLKVVESQLSELRAAEQATRPLGSPELVQSANAASAVRALPSTLDSDDAIAG
ncbi:hypothetical protein Aph01nite_35750 [Acrocarpospora phusangensis]|uniref:Uncharacterized protein n=1 Tax=Acrocarpospora phusangensis TaxID=1070424 RepID=A0A919UR78_9ACTN|nr:hypothetical protein Aph01nite_35750 [Acrocarpospora phusangensis]